MYASRDLLTKPNTNILSWLMNKEMQTSKYVHSITSQKYKNIYKKFKALANVLSYLVAFLDVISG
jgi:hypothetical protein